MAEPQTVVERVLREFDEMPGLRLTRAQLARLCGLDQLDCEPVIHRLVGERVLASTPGGMLVRAGAFDRVDHIAF